MNYSIGDWNMSDEPAFLLQPVAVLGLSNRALWALSGQLNSSAYKSPLPPEVATVGELIDKTSVELMRIPNIGVVSVREIREALARRGLYLRGEHPDATRQPAPPSVEQRLVAIEAKLDAILSRLAEPCVPGMNGFEMGSSSGGPGGKPRHISS